MKAKISSKEGFSGERIETSLIKAARINSRPGVMSALRDDPDSIFVQDETGMTALHWAASNRNIMTAELILKKVNRRDDLWIKDDAGLRALDHAIESGDPFLIKLLSHATYGQPKRD